MVNDDYILAVREAITVMEDALGDVRKRLDLAMQYGEGFNPAWTDIGQAAQKLSKQCIKLQQQIEGVKLGENKV